MIKLLVAGACYSSGSSFEKCALQPQECSDSSIYRTSKWLLENDDAKWTTCSSQDMIHDIKALGRCDSSGERFICTSHMTGCRVGLTFKEYDSDCTVVDDFRIDNPYFTKSYFPYCRNDGVYRAVWQNDECSVDEDFRTTDPFYAGNYPEYQCDDLTIGACVSNTNLDDYFCAVTENVCSQEAGFTYKKSFEVETDLGVTCKLCDKLPNPPERKKVIAGACVKNKTSKFRRCALMPSDCDDGEKFISSLSIKDSPVDTPEEAICLTSEGVQSVRVGRCDKKSKSKRICVSDKSACDSPKNFRAKEDTCTLGLDLDPDSNSKIAHYGYCSTEDSNSGFQPGDGEAYCAWSDIDCQATNPDAKQLNYHDAYGNSPNCRCDYVRTGACISDSNQAERHCAVTSEVCDSGYSFVNVRDLEVTTGPNLVCHLCDKLEPPKNFKELKENMCDTEGLLVFVETESNCEAKCAENTSCQAYQVIENVGCTLYSGKSVIGAGDHDSTKGYESYRKRKKKKKLKKTNGVCNPDGILSVTEDLQQYKCSKKCKKTTKCKYYMMAQDVSTCILYRKKGKPITKAKKRIMKKFTCYILE